MTVWRYVDFGFQVRDETKFNLDIEGLNWAPVGGQVIADFYEEFEIRLDCDSSTLLGSGCGAHDFVMTCDAKSDGDELRCESSHPYTGGSLRWQRD